MIANPDAGWTYVTTETTVTGGATRTEIALASSAAEAAGVWELLNVTIKRTAGAAAATYTPSVADRDSADLLDALWIANAALSAAVVSNAAPGRIWRLMSLPYFLPGANVGGDTWVMRALWRRRLA